jgi:hypothetical protein
VLSVLPIEYVRGWSGDGQDGGVDVRRRNEAITDASTTRNRFNHRNPQLQIGHPVLLEYSIGRLTSAFASCPFITVW